MKTKITESQLRNIITCSIKKVLLESVFKTKDKAFDAAGDYNNVYEVILIIKSDYNPMKFVIVANSEDEARKEAKRKGMNYSAAMDRENDVEIYSVKLIKQGQPFIEDNNTDTPISDDFWYRYEMQHDNY